MDIMNLTYDEMEATFRKKKRTMMPKLWSYSKKLPDPYAPRYYTRIELFIPQPTLFSPLPCVLVSIRNAKFKSFFRILDLSDLESVFAIPEEEHQKASQALSEAREQADKIEEGLRDMIQRKRLPEAVRAAQRIADSQTGEILCDDAVSGQLTE